MIGEGEEGDLGAGQGLGDEDGGLDDLGDGKADGIGERTCAEGATLRGIDVSKYQGDISWTKVKNSGISFAFIRVSDGVSAIDPKFRPNWANAKSAGVVRGVYQFFRPGQDPVAQADRLISAVGQLDDDDLPPVIDVEVTGGMDAATIRQRVQRWVAHVEQELGRRPIIYTGAYFWRDSVGGGSTFAQHPLWIAQYTERCPRLPSPWRSWAFWQNSDSGSVPGIVGDVDTNHFDGQMGDLEDLITASDLRRPQPTPPVDDGYGPTEPVEEHQEIEDLTAFPR